MKETPKAVIVGAGISGLVCAIALQRQNISVRVLEQADTLAPVGAGLSLWPNALHALGALGLSDAVTAAGARLRRGEIRQADGRVLSSMDTAGLAARTGMPCVMIHRAALHGLLLQALAPDTVSTGQTAESVVAAGGEGTPARLRLHSGEELEADILIAADGANSRIRRQLWPASDLVYRGYTAWRGIVRAPHSARLGESGESWGRGCRFGWSAVDHERIYWFATANQPAGETVGGEARLSRLQTLFGDWHAPIPTLLEATPAEDILQNDIHDLPPLASWHRGRTVLLGDAAHPTTPNLGQGACMGIESALVLARQLDRHTSPEAAFKAFFQQRHKRVTGVMLQSRRIGAAGQWSSPAACWLRNRLASVIPSRLSEWQLDRLVQGFTLP
ncbi:MAG: FAD-dependent monooxygenase [Natronospirillum sp.]|uniref:FAD-dependent monooxygenase n=1 Tax=Natronospirillum sp. TaxID=2812955 RepID=UPI0025FEB093|nr:FAD-dependent monooxygenase [Natronospirillum sp.]MCH8550979.1 FAD-dependent monooxygenase [Natronospirillum sp.]